MNMQSATIIGGASKNKRRESDFYPTPAECTHALLTYFKPFLGRQVWEPACGDGAISKILINYSFVDSTDLYDRGYGVSGCDFLECRLPIGVTSIVTNPPWSIADKFIRRARSFGIPFAMLLKSTYWHAKSREALFKETGPSAILPLLWRPAMKPELGKSPTMEIIWTVWNAEPSDRCEYLPLPKPNLGDAA